MVDTQSLTISSCPTFGRLKRTLRMPPRPASGGVSSKEQSVDGQANREQLAVPGWESPRKPEKPTALQSVNLVLSLSSVKLHIPITKSINLSGAFQSLFSLQDWNKWLRTAHFRWDIECAD